jgi:two-component system sensor histidine kinase KdpD
MKKIFFLKISPKQQYFYALGLILAITSLSFMLLPYIGYKVVALLLLLSVSVLAMLLDIFPVLLAATLSALIWDFFFIPPRFTFVIGSAEDILLFVMYFVIALLNAILTSKIKNFEQKVAQKEEQQRILQLYDSLLNSLSHELRTPIATIIGTTDILKDNYTMLQQGQKQELITEISIAGLRLHEQIENLLSMSRLHSGALQLKNVWCEVQELSNSLFQKLQTKHNFTIIENIENQNIIDKNNHCIQIFIAENFPLVRIDSGLLEQILYNLLNNALLYTPKGSIIQLFINYITNNQAIDKIQIIVKDNGNGFPKNEIDKVFDKFYRLQNTKAGGTGLGLSIVKGFVEAMQGTVLLENIEENQQICGAKFTILLPIKIYQNVEITE